MVLQCWTSLLSLRLQLSRCVPYLPCGHSTARVLYPLLCLSVFLQVHNCAGLQVWAAADDLMPIFAEIDRTVAANLRKVQKAFRDNRIGPHHFQGSTGYGHGDWGRESLDKVRRLGT